MIFFVEGPDSAAKDELYNHAVDSDVFPGGTYFFDMDVKMATRGEFGYSGFSGYSGFPETALSIYDALFYKIAQMRFAMELSYRYPKTTMFLRNGPMSMLDIAIRQSSPMLELMVSEIFTSETYQNIAVISVSSKHADAETAKRYREIISSRMSMLSDESKGNSYKSFMYMCNDASKKVFVNDIAALINK